MDATSAAHFGQRQEAAEPPHNSSILTHEVKSGANWLEPRQNGDFGIRLARCAAHVREARDFVPFVRERDSRRAEKLEECGSWLLFRDYLRLGQIKLASGVFCQQPLLCGFCASGRAARQGETLTAKVGHVVEAHRHLVPYMVTLTMKGQPQLRPMVAKFWAAWGKLVQRRRDAIKGRNDSVMGLIAGGFLAGEAKRGKAGQWHYHGHGMFLADVQRYSTVWERLMREWAAVIGQGHASVQFEPVALGGTPDAVRECCKYASKWEPGAYADRWEAFEALSRVRRLRVFGLLHGVKLPEEVGDDLSALEAEEYIERAFRYSQGGYEEVPYAQRERAFDDWNQGGSEQ